jgi:hypothetical protein
MIHPLRERPESKDDRQSNIFPCGISRIPTNQREYLGNLCQTATNVGRRRSGQAGGQDWDHRFPEDLAPLADELIE